MTTNILLVSDEIAKSLLLSILLTSTNYALQFHHCARMFKPLLMLGMFYSDENLLISISEP